MTFARDPRRSSGSFAAASLTVFLGRAVLDA